MANIFIVSIQQNLTIGKKGWDVANTEGDDIYTELQATDQAEEKTA